VARLGVVRGATRLELSGGKLGPCSKDAEDGMAKSSAKTPDAYFDALDGDRREALTALRDLVRKTHLDVGKGCIRFRRLDQLPLAVVKTVLRAAAKR
jgi:hypothetical protein